MRWPYFLRNNDVHCFCVLQPFNNMHASWKSESIKNLHLLPENLFMTCLLWLIYLRRLSKETRVWGRMGTLTLTPCGPGLPLGPGMPGGPARPLAPVIPAIPSGPGAPCWTNKKALVLLSVIMFTSVEFVIKNKTGLSIHRATQPLTGGPWGPGDPFSPGWPASPLGPDTPGLPGAPLLPGGPGGPSLPGAPLEPGGPGLPYKDIFWNLKFWNFYNEKVNVSSLFTCILDGI